MGDSRSREGDRLRAAGGILAAVVTAALAFASVHPAAATPSPPSADDDLVSIARGQFLSGSIAGVDLSRLAALTPARAQNDGSRAVLTDEHPLGVEVLGARVVSLPGGVSVDLGPGLDTGVIGQYAQARGNGTARAGSGAVGSTGGVNVGPTTSGTGGDLVLDLRALLGSGLTDAIADIELRLAAAQAEAELTVDGTQGTSSLADAHLEITSPAVAKLGNKVSSALDTVTGSLDHLTSTNGPIAAEVSAAVNPLLAPAGVRANVAVSIDTDVRGVVSPLLRSTYAADGVSVNLETGRIVVDLAALTGRSLSNPAPNTELLSGPAVRPALQGVTGSLATLIDSIVDAVRDELRSARVSVTATASVLTPQTSGTEERCRDVTRTIAGSSESGSSSGSGGQLGGLIGGLLGGVGDIVEDTVGDTVETITETVCEVVEVPLPDLRTSLDLRLAGSLRAMLDGRADASAASLTVLGTPVTIAVPSLSTSVGAVLDAQLLGGGGAVADLERRLTATLLDPAVGALLGDHGLGALGGLLSIRLNVQETTSGSVEVFEQTAVRVAVGQLATLDIAQAAVGPVGGPADGGGDPGDPGDGGPGDGGPGDGGPGTGGPDDGGPGGPSGPGGPGGDSGDPTLTGSPDRLAMTGASILAILLLTAGLLIAGATLLHARRTGGDAPA